MLVILNESRIIQTDEIKQVYRSTDEYYSIEFKNNGIDRISKCEFLALKKAIESEVSNG